MDLLLVDIGFDDGAPLGTDNRSLINTIDLLACVVLIALDNSL